MAPCLGNECWWHAGTDTRAALAAALACVSNSIDTTSSLVSMLNQGALTIWQTFQILLEVGWGETAQNGHVFFVLPFTETWETLLRILQGR